MRKRRSLPTLFGTLFALAFFALALSVLAAASPAHAQQTISGTVTAGDTGESLPGASVLAVGTQVGTATNAQGEYTLENVSSSADSLRFSFTGYQAQTVAIAGRSLIDVALESATAELGEVVVIGYGERSEELLTESISSVSAEEIGELPITDPTQALEGRVAGVQITQTGAGPGSPSSVRIRGVGSTANSQPLYVIDGVPVGTGGGEGISGGGVTNPLATINPADIASISVLKDASAAAVYGVRAANGVILIETKSGEGQEPTFSFNSYLGSQRLPDTYEFNSTAEYFALREEALANYNQQLGLQEGDDGYLQLDPELRGADSEARGIDNTGVIGDAALNESALVQNYHLSASGGTENLNYYVSGGYRDSESNVVGEELKRYSFRINSDYDVTDWLRIGENLTVSRTEEQLGRNPRGLAASTGRLPPFFSVFDEDDSVPGDFLDRFTGNLIDPGSGSPEQIGGLVGTGNPLARYFSEDTQYYTNRLLGNVSAEVFLPLEGLSLRGEASLDYIAREARTFTKPYTRAEVGSGNNEEQINRNNETDRTQVYSAQLNYDRDLGEHSIDLLALAEYQRIDTELFGSGGTELFSLAENCRLISCAGSFNPVTETATEQTYHGYVGRLTYDYADKYLLTATVRRDGTSAFAPGNRWGTFPSLSAGWRVAQEPFMEALPVVSTLKLRGGIGQLGNDRSVNAFAYLNSVRQAIFLDNYAVGDSLVLPAFFGGLTNESLQWETVQTTDVGVNLGFFEDRLTLGATYYRRNTKDLLLGVSVSNVSGDATAPVNLGNVLNTGVELQAGYNDTFGDFSFDVGANLTTVHNELTELREGINEFTTSGGVYRTAVGQPIGYLFGYVTDGLYRTEAEAETAPVDIIASGFSTEQQVGDVKYVDFATPCSDVPDQCEEGQRILREPDGRITAADRTKLGDTIPDLSYGFNFDMQWRDFDLGLFFAGETGFSRYNQFRRGALGLSGSTTNQLADSQDRYSEDNTDADLPRAVANDPNNNLRFSDLWVEDASFLRLKNVQLGYSVPSSLVNGAFQRARLYVAVSNVFTVTGYSGLDPTVREVNPDPGFSDAQVGTQLAAGTDSGLLPQPRTYRVGLQLQF